MIVALKDVNKSYQRGDETIVALNNLNLEVSKGDFLSIMGPKQSGKSSLLNLIGGLDTPTSGSIKVDGDVGFLFQFYNLLPTLSVFRNVQIPLLLSKLSNSQRKEHVERVLNIVNLLDESEQQVSQLSLEQQQRTSIARALVTDPQILVCDEPTTNLDKDMAIKILQLLHTLNQDHGKTILMATHDPVDASFTKNTFMLPLNIKNNGDLL
tara:strand:- start:687 stop:1316 length:630 start_codon:yes stop_codon:yes gene_type:complete